MRKKTQLIFPNRTINVVFLQTYKLSPHTEEHAKTNLAITHVSVAAVQRKTCFFARNISKHCPSFCCHFALFMLRNWWHVTELFWEIHRRLEATSKFYQARVTCNEALNPSMVNSFAWHGEPNMFLPSTSLSFTCAPSLTILAPNRCGA